MLLALLISLTVTSCVNDSVSNLSSISDNSSTTDANKHEWNETTKKLLIDNFGEVIPFIKLNDEYTSVYDEVSGVLVISDYGSSIVNDYKSVLDESGFKERNVLDSAYYVKDSAISDDSELSTLLNYANGNYISIRLIPKTSFSFGWPNEIIQDVLSTNNASDIDVPQYHNLGIVTYVKDSSGIVMAFNSNTNALETYNDLLLASADTHWVIDSDSIEGIMYSYALDFSERISISISSIEKGSYIISITTNIVKKSYDLISDTFPTNELSILFGASNLNLIPKPENIGNFGYKMKIDEENSFVEIKTATEKISINTLNNYKDLLIESGWSINEIDNVTEAKNDKFKNCIIKIYLSNNSLAIKYNKIS